MKLSEEEWKKKLTPEQYRILRQKGTEMPFTGALLDEKREGVFKCAVCSAELFSSEHKFESDSGWPSFYDVAKSGAVELHDDNSLGMHRIEVTCANCGSHLGHVFDDLPASRPDMYFVYAILCENGDIYIGQTNNLQERWKKHCNGTGASHTKKNNPQKIIHYEIYNSRDKAVEREKWLKTGFGRKWLKREWKAGRTRQAGGPQNKTGKRYCINSACLAFDPNKK